MLDPKFGTRGRPVHKLNCALHLERLHHSRPSFGETSVQYVRDATRQPLTVARVTFDPDESSPTIDMVILAAYSCTDEQGIGCRRSYVLVTMCKQRGHNLQLEQHCATFRRESLNPASISQCRVVHRRNGVRLLR